METTSSISVLSDQERWESLLRRNNETQLEFFYGVSTTGIYCRPGCSSRIPNRQNVRFFNTCDEAEKAGFRPCKRCNPRSNLPGSINTEMIVKTCRIIEEADTPPSLKSLANEMGLSPYYFQRLFKNIIGITPRQYFMEVRSKRIRDNLQSNTSITDVIFRAGYDSSGRFYDQSSAMLGMKPTEYKNGGSGILIHYTIAPSYLGLVLIAASSKGICTIEIGDNSESLEINIKKRFPNAVLQEDDSEFSSWVSDFLSYLESPIHSLDLPLDIQGTAFQRHVWNILQDIPAGSTKTYTEIAIQLGNPKSFRAVARACASNHLAVAIPCHRAVRKNGELAGYRWGIERKRKLLEHEREESKK